jgi:isoamylase
MAPRSVRRWSGRAYWWAEIGGCVDPAQVPAARPATDFTARLIPPHEGAVVPSAPGPIRWQRRSHNTHMRSPEHSLPDSVAEVSADATVRTGVPLSLGPHQVAGGVNFAFFNRHASQVRLERSDHPTDASPAKRIDLDPAHNRTGDVWHVWVGGIRPGQLYAYRVAGPYRPNEGHRFNFNKLLLEPNATAITPLAHWDFGAACGYDRSAPETDLALSIAADAEAMPKYVITHEHFERGEDRPLRHPWSETVIYEMHVCGFTIHSSAAVAHPGPYRGLMERIPYLKTLGVTAVELMPVYAFNESQVIGINPQTGERLRNNWGSDSVVFLAPQGSSSRAGGLGQHKREFKEMVRVLHEAGIEVLLDVVLNNTAEGNELGPTICFRGIDNAMFYVLKLDRRYYEDCAGTGNTRNANHPVVREHILGVLRYWAVEIHGDGFRFDFPSILGRDGNGNVLSNAPLLDRIAEDLLLRDVKIIAEAWDAAGAFEVGSFYERCWMYWNGRYGDDVRRFWRGDDGMLGLFASRICGSADVCAKSGKGPECSINFITGHDGFTSNDLVSYREKHKEANRECNRDGAGENLSENDGVEGETEDIRVEAARLRQIKNLLLTVVISHGVPRLLGGDAFRRAQGGNNHAYCQDNKISGYHWGELERHPDIYRFAREMIAFRRTRPIQRVERYYTEAEIQWFGPTGELPDRLDPKAKQLACLIHEVEYEHSMLCFMFIVSSEPAAFCLPEMPMCTLRHVAVDTSCMTAHDPVSRRVGRGGDVAHLFPVAKHASAILIARGSKNAAEPQTKLYEMTDAKSWCLR